MNKSVKELIQFEFDEKLYLVRYINQKNSLKKELNKLGICAVFNLFIIPIPFYLRKRNELIKSINTLELCLNEELEKLKTTVRKHSLIEKNDNIEVDTKEVVQQKYKLNQNDYLTYSDYPPLFEIFRGKIVGFSDDYFDNSMDSKKYKYSIMNIPSGIKFENIKLSGDFSKLRVLIISRISSDMVRNIYGDDNMPDYIKKQGFKCFFDAVFETYKGDNLIVAIESGDLYTNCFRDSYINEVHLSEGIKNIDVYSFDGCSKLKSIIIPSSMEEIKEKAFMDCNGLTEVYYKGNNSAWNNILIGYCNESLNNATRYYYSETKPSNKGNYWHYVNGAVVKW